MWVTLTFLQAAPCPRVQCCQLLTGTNCVKLWPHTWPVRANAQLSKVNPKQPHLLFVFDHPPMVSYSSYWVVYLFEMLERETKVCFASTQTHTNTEEYIYLSSVDTFHCFWLPNPHIHTYMMWVEERWWVKRKQAVNKCPGQRKCRWQTWQMETLGALFTI